MSLARALATSLSLLLITCGAGQGAAVPPHPSAPQCIFDPSGYFYAAGKLPQPFEEFDHLTFLKKSGAGEAPPGQGLYASQGRVYRFDSLKSGADSLEFTTDAVGGVSYSFAGKFEYFCIFEESDELSNEPGTIAAAGKLLKLVDGKTAAETFVQLTYAPKPRDSRDDPNARFPSGRTELFYAVRKGDLKSIRAMLARGADVNVRDRDGMTPLAFGIDTVPDHARATAVARTLIAAGADVNLKDETGKTPLKLAVYQFEDRKGELVRVLLDAGADANAADDYGTTVLMHAVHAANQVAALNKNVGALIRAGADVNARNKLGQTALSIAGEAQNDALVNLLKQAGARP